jgi:hypothetical protein
VNRPADRADVPLLVVTVIWTPPVPLGELTVMEVALLLRSDVAAFVPK